MGISVRDGKFLSGARKVFHGYFGYADLLAGGNTASLPISTTSLNELFSINSGLISILSGYQGLYYVDMYIPFITAGSFTLGDNFDLAWYNDTDTSYPDIEDYGFGHNFVTGSIESFCRHSLILEFLSGKNYTLNIRTNTLADYYTSDGFIRIYKL